MFSRPRIESIFSKYVPVRLHTDQVPVGVRQVPDAAGARGLRDQKFHNFALPYYVVVRPKGKVLTRVAFYEKGLINDENEFAEFLEAALQAR